MPAACIMRFLAVRFTTPPPPLWLHSDMNQTTSQDVFLGPYLDDAEVRAKFSKGYTAMTDGFLVSWRLPSSCWSVCRQLCCAVTTGALGRAAALSDRRE